MSANGAAAARRDDDEVGARVPASPAARARAYRARKQQQLDAAVTAPITAPGAPSVTVQRRDGRVTLVATFAAALMLASVSGSFAIVGLTTIFGGAFWPVIGMGAAMEAGKLAAVAWLGRGYVAPLPIKLAIIGLVAVLMQLNAAGAYGYLVRAHLDHVVTGELAIDGRAAEVEARIRVATDTLADIDKRVAQVDAAVDSATRRGRGAAAMALAAGETKRRALLLVERVTAATKLGVLQVEAAAVAGARQRLAADLGPIRYLGALFHVDDAALLRLFILVVACLLDPLAVVLLLAASSSRRVS